MRSTIVFGSIGGYPTMRFQFIHDNGIPRIKSTLTHLLHGGPSDHVVRMADCIFDPKYQLQHFGDVRPGDLWMGQ